ncbi:MAG: hypothetical protein M3Z23_15915, partial [Acidobacteriota bacterium]|nr:hypothetical protein [Acidobacteriota bacterium]
RMQDWKSIACAKRLGIPEEQLDLIVAVLEALDASFRPLVATIPGNVEPSIILSEPAVLGH